MKDMINQVFNEDCLETMKRIEDKRVFSKSDTLVFWFVSFSLNAIKSFSCSNSRASKVALIFSSGRVCPQVEQVLFSTFITFSFKALPSTFIDSECSEYVLNFFFLCHVFIA